MHKKDIFKSIHKEYGVNLPGIDDARIVKIFVRRDKKWTMYHMKDIETGITSCGFTLGQCKKGLAELLLR
jgi:hypothetical protein